MDKTFADFKASYHMARECKLMYRIWKMIDPSCSRKKRTEGSDVISLMRNGVEEGRDHARWSRELPTL